MKHIEEGLKILGLKNKEVKIYLALLARGNSSPTELSDMVKIPRTTINFVLKNMEKRGFLEQISVKNHREWKVVELASIKKKLENILKMFE